MLWILSFAGALLLLNGSLMLDKVLGCSVDLTGVVEADTVLNFEVLGLVRDATGCWVNGASGLVGPWVEPALFTLFFGFFVLFFF
jgi:hypothetical protein